MPDWCKECPFYYDGMSPEDYLYLQYHIKKTDPSIFVKLIMREIALPPIRKRTKEDVFNAVGADLNYVFDINTMC